ncbi:MAG: acetyl ornithine aminotransferase family protein [Candidatus Riflebacteria bacterium]|nr:acetyl ornithine aminotransferase family protein [Candidatus Riflebacteria bacterium]
MAMSKTQTAELLPKIVGDLPGPRARELLKLDATYVSPSYTRTYPLVADRGEGCLVWDPDGNRFLDFAAGIAVCATGHCHPQIVKVIQEQAARLIHMSGTDFYYRAQVDAAKAVGDIVPIQGGKRAFLCNSGAEAVECAIKLARYHTVRRHLISFHGAFHGRTYGAMSLSYSKVIHKRRMGPCLADTTAIPYAYCYRCPVGKTYPGCSVECLDVLEKVVFTKGVPPEEVAAIFVEPIQGEGGYVPAPMEFLRRLREIATKHGIMLVFDEVQSGMGRTGKFFASEHTGIVGDIYCIAKGVASGMPLGVTVASSSVMSWASGAHATTFGGNPLACVAAIKTIELLEQGLLAHCETMGERLMGGLAQLAKESPIVGDLRGKGLMIGMEIVTDRATNDPDAQTRDRIVDECFKRGLLLLGCGPNTVRFCPPLVVKPEQIDWAVNTIGQVMAQLASHGGGAKAGR